MGKQDRLACSLACLLACFLFSACNRAPELGAGPLQIELVSGATATDTVLRVSGLSSTELRALADARFDESQWQALLRVTVSDTDVAAVSGRFAATASALEYRPRFPFDPGRSYTARFDPARLPAPRTEAAVTARVRLAAGPAPPPTTVTRIFPSSDVWPENMLRFYVHFSAPMSRGAGSRFVHLMNDRGEEEADAILAAYGDLWNDDTTRLTVFFDPGRVKRGVGPNVAMGRAIVQGRRYAITVDPAWKDAAGQPLAAPFRREFTAGPAAYSALSAHDWTIAPPRAGTRDALTVTFPASLDRALLDRTLGVAMGRPTDGALQRLIEGAIQVGPQELSWSFVPASPWQAGPAHLVVLSLLEDPSGNKIGRAFEVLATDPSAQPDNRDVVFRPFEIK